MVQETKIIEELDFVLTHPSCTVVNLEHFYNTCLYCYESVPLLSIVGHIKKNNPILLNEWSNANSTVRNLLSEMEPDIFDNEDEGISVSIDLSKELKVQKGLYQVIWNTRVSDNVVKKHFKNRTLKVIDKLYGQVELMGYSRVDETKYNLYIHMRRISE